MFPEMYAAYNSQFYSAMINGMSINASFENLTNTAFWEQYMVNAFQFSGAKNLSEMKELQSLVFDENKVRRSFSEFQKLALPRLEKYQQYLRVEYDLAVRGAVLAEQWQDIWRDRDINPYAIYKTREDNRVRDEHRILDNICFLIDSPEASMIYPPSDWNCRCYWDTDSEKNSLYKTRDELKALIKDNIPVEFQRNVGTDGIMPSPKYFYKDALSNANDAQYSMFEPKRRIETPQEILEKKLTKIENEIKNDKYETLVCIDKNGNELVRQKGSKTKVRLSNEESNKIVKDSIITHNHPGATTAPKGSMLRIGTSFSIQDIKTAVIKDLSEIRAVKIGRAHV
jgi:hypothetical protein